MGIPFSEAIRESKCGSCSGSASCNCGAGVSSSAEKLNLRYLFPDSKKCPECEMPLLDSWHECPFCGKWFGINFREGDE